MTDRGGYHHFAATLDLEHSPEARVSAHGAVFAAQEAGDQPHRVVIANLRDDAPGSAVALYLTPDQAEATARMLMAVAQQVRTYVAPPVGATGAAGTMSIPTVTAWPVEARPAASEEE